MRDQGLIYGGLAIFLGFITFPVSYNLVAGKTSKGPELKLPVAEKQCVAPVDYMKGSHMKLLMDWRENLVRKNIRTYTAFDGRSYTISLNGTCLGKCHSSKADFCDRCHSYVGIQTPYCMDCHIDPKLIQRSGE